jgi:hypothetical protein
MAAAATGDDSDRDLKTKEETTASESESGDILTKRSETMVNILVGGLLVTKPGAEAQSAGAGTKRKQASMSSEAGDYHDRDPKRKEASASEDDDGALKEEGDSLFKEGDMLKLREEYWEAALLWEEKLVPGALDRWLERKITQVPGVNKKKKKVVRIITPNAYMDDIIENPDMMRELSDDEYCQSYAIAKFINAKNHAYQQALIDQYHAFGFAYDEKEVTEVEEVVVV